MQDRSEAPAFDAARAGDSAAFALLIEPHRRELLVHCYRMLGSIEDAEDALQETFLQAWRRLETIEGRASFRAWCFKVATRAALKLQDKRRRRAMPMSTHAPADPRDPLPPANPEAFWLEPLPDALLPTQNANPEALYDARESVSLAFLAALQYLPGRQRAVLILRDVLAWRADEVAELLDTSPAAVNSILQRARVSMRAVPAGYRTQAATPMADARIAALLAEYLRAWEEADVPGLTALLRGDAVKTMPPLPSWYRGPAAIQAFLLNHLFAGDAVGRFRLTPTRANGGPAFAGYACDAGGVYHPSGLHVLSITPSGIAAIHCFLAPDDRLFTRFGLPLTC